MGRSGLNWRPGVFFSYSRGLAAVVATPALIADLALEACQAHHPTDEVLAAALAHFLQVVVHPAVAVNTAVPQLGLLNKHGLRHRDCGL